MKSVALGLIGLGTVGSGLVKLLRDRGQFLAAKLGFRVELVRACDRDRTRARELKVKAPVFTTAATDVLHDPAVQVVVELIGGLEPARTFILTALRAGKHVVTANKALLAQHGPELFATAQEYGVSLRADASVAGGIPILSMLDTCLTANRISSLYGIINGTTNYILTRMERAGSTLADALAEAQRLGFAEADPTLDLRGLDAAHKLTVLATLISGQTLTPRQVYCEGIEAVTPIDIHHAAELGYVLKLLAIAKLDPPAAGLPERLEVRVHPTLVPRESPLATVRNEYNAIYFTGDAVGPQMVYGKGAGAQPTASAVLADVLQLGRGLQPTNIYYRAQPLALVPIGELHTHYYLRFSTVDRPGVLGRLCTVLGEHRISISSCLQQEHQETKKSVHIVIMTHAAREADLTAALRRIDRLPFIKQPTRFIRIERV